MIRAILVDDDPKAISSLSTLLKWYCEDEVEIVGHANDLSTAQNLTQEIQPDLVFLDIDLGQENGFMLLEKIKKSDWNVSVIFTTGHSEYVINALRNEAFDYLLKPIDPDDLKDSVRRLKEKLAQGTPPKENNSSPAESLFTLQMQDQVRIFRYEEIIRCESDRNYTRFFLATGNSLMVSRTLGSFEQQLSQHNFFRSHKSHMVNLGHLKSYVRQDGGHLLMSDGTRVPLGRNHRSTLFELLGL